FAKNWGEMPGRQARISPGSEMLPVSSNGFDRKCFEEVCGLLLDQGAQFEGGTNGFRRIFTTAGGVGPGPTDAARGAGSRGTVEMPLPDRIFPLAVAPPEGHWNPVAELA